MEVAEKDQSDQVQQLMDTEEKKHCIKVVCRRNKQ